MPLGGALKFQIVPLKSKLRGDFCCVNFNSYAARAVLKFHVASLNDKFCAIFARCFRISRRTKKRLNLKFTRCFGAAKFQAFCRKVEF